MSICKNNTQKKVYFRKNFFQVDTNIYVPVCLPDPGSDYEGEDAWVTG